MSRTPLLRPLVSPAAVPTDRPTDRLLAPLLRTLLWYDTGIFSRLISCSSLAPVVLVARQLEAMSDSS